ncbi:hypothetical protein ON753_19495 [Roseibium sp. DSM 29163]|uniref:Spermidine/putrescine transport system substrate-binding protein n=1 Tax=Roseibium salinum TaxID=1604349 RepID=A0ABT3R5T9_9HYPH|nr:hypothetical protein [Roseibium sp. DSM 29163]
MKLKTVILAGTALAFASSAALAKDMTIVSWGGAYQASQKNAYADPYMEKNPDINVIWDEIFQRSGCQAACDERSRQHHVGSG